jgi:hypothetical protein
VNTQDLLPVLQGKAAQAVERHPTPSAARSARAKAYQLLYKAAERHGLLPLTARLYVDPLDPCLLICDSTPREAPPSRYEPVLSLQVGQACELILGNTLLQSVKARLKELAAQVEADLGTRPCWVARPVPGQPGDYLITRLPDGHSPATGLPRHNDGTLAGQQHAEEARRDYARMYELEMAWSAANERAFDLGQDPPPMPEELRALEAKYGINNVNDDQVAALLEPRYAA